MKCSGEICKRCLHNSLKIKMDDESMEVFMYYCPVAAHMTLELPDDCPYVLEHLLVTQEEVNVDTMGN